MITEDEARKYRTAAHFLDGVAQGIEDAIDHMNWAPGKIGGKKFSTADLVHCLYASAVELKRRSALRKARFADDDVEFGEAVRWIKLALFPEGSGVRWHSRGGYLGPTFGTIAEAERYLLQLNDQGKTPGLKAKWIALPSNEQQS